MTRDGGNRLADRSIRIVEALQPVVEVDVGAVELALRDAARQHLLLEVTEAHMAGAAGGVRHHHYLRHPEFVHRHYEAPHRRVPGRRNHGPGILDDLGVPVPEPQRLLQQYRQPRVHTAEHRQLLIGELISDVLLVALGGHKLAIEGENGVDVGHRSMVLRFDKDTDNSTFFKPRLAVNPESSYMGVYRINYSPTIS